MNIKVSNYTVGKDQPLLLIAGPCVAESLEMCRHVAGALREYSLSRTNDFSCLHDHRLFVSRFRQRGVRLDFIRREMAFMEIAARDLFSMADAFLRALEYPRADDEHHFFF